MQKDITDVHKPFLKSWTCHLILHGAHRCLPQRKLPGLLKSSSPLHGSLSSHFHGSSAEFEESHQVMAEALSTQRQ
jgi:hypothetical protein